MVGGCACHIETLTPYTTNPKSQNACVFPRCRSKCIWFFSSHGVGASEGALGYHSLPCAKGIYQSRPSCIGSFTSRLALTQRTSGDQSRSNAQTSPQDHGVPPQEKNVVQPVTNLYIPLIGENTTIGIPISKSSLWNHIK